MSYPRIYNAAVDMVDRNVAQGRGAKPAFIDPDRDADLRRAAGALQPHGQPARHLRHRRASRASRCCCSTRSTFPVAFWGAIKAGVVPVCLNTLLTTEQYAYILGDSRAQGAVRVGAAAARGAADPRPAAVPQAHLRGGRRGAGVRAVVPRRAAASSRPSSRPPTPAATRPRSGSTRRARPACPRACATCTRARWRRRASRGQGCLGMREDDLVFSAAKLFFAYGLGNAMSFPMSVGATAVLLPERPTPEVVFRTLKQHQPTMFFGVPTLYAAMLAYPQGTPENSSQRLRLCVSAGEALPAEVGKAFRARFGVDVLDGVGSTEMLHQYVCNSPGDVKYGTSGKPVPGYEIRLVDEQGKRRGRRRGRRDAGARARAPPRATGTSARRAAPPSRAAGRARATSTRATPRATTPTRAAPTTCSRCRASGCRRSRWRAR